MKVPVDRLRTLLIFVIADLVLAVALFLSCMNLFLFSEWGVVQILIIALFVILSVFMLVLSLVRNYYVIESKYLVVVKGPKVMYYYYTDVVYIDIPQTEKRKVLCFFTNKGHARYLPFDKNQEIYKAMKKKCHNLLSDADFKAQYPDAKL